MRKCNNTAWLGHGNQILGLLTDEHLFYPALGNPPRPAEVLDIKEEHLEGEEEYTMNMLWPWEKPVLGKMRFVLLTLTFALIPQLIKFPKQLWLDGVNST